MILHGAVEWSKHHPYMLAGGVFVGGAVLIFVYYSKGSSAAPAASGDAAQLQAQVASESIQAQYAAQVSAAQTQAQSVATQVNGAVAINDRNASVSEANIEAQQTLGLATIGAQQTLGLATVGAQKDVQIAGITGQTTLAQIQADSANHQTDSLFGYLSSQLMSSAEYNALSGRIASSDARSAQISNDQGTLTTTLENLVNSTSRDANRLNQVWTSVNGGPGIY